MRREIVQFNVKIPKALIDLIDKDIEATGEYRNRSEWAIAAIRYFQEYRQKLLSERKLAYEEGKKN